ncbi:MAG: UDP-N-acetylmuramoyl-L-alanine--D-glutamate ligase [Rikenellaceae bacterium]
MSKKLVILGGGVSGYGTAILAKKQGFDVFLSDRGSLSEKYIALLEEWGVEYEQGGHSVERIMEADEVVKSPGIPDKAELIVALRAKGTPVVSEIEFAGRYIGDAKVVCITGSNGKTTTTSLIYKVLKDAGLNVALGGNIGESFAYSVATQSVDWYVLEISSFQLDGMFDFRSDIAVLMNITPDHLDRYDYKFENYAASKLRVAQNQTPSDWFIYSEDDPTIAAALQGDALPGSAVRVPFGKQYIAEGSGAISVSCNGVEMVLDSTKMQIAGLHNCYNAQAAAQVALAAGVGAESIARSIYSFSPVEHRLEPAGTVENVEFINDSKATNVDSVWYALESMTKPTVWIAGGTDKGNDYEPLKAFARQKVHTLVCMGVDNAALEKAFCGVVPTIISCGSLDAAMKAAVAAANSGDAVLLSPACASFDLFKNYENRGELFKEWVANYAKSEEK